ncbi:MAG: rhomboid family intramembrane serine protease [Dehalococcoidia bacterium]|nr:rhomboid family intramembrane serine protease [Dehalococcoidia bacterium]
MRSYRPVSLGVLWFLIALNVVIFIITLIMPREVVGALGLTPGELSERPWAMVSSMFVHGSPMHILFNMIALYFLGSFLVRTVGERGFLAVFFLGGLAGNVLFALLAHPESTGIGASGGVYALGGALAIMVPKVPVIIFPIPVPMPLWVAIVIFFFLSFLPGIAWQAHLGGLFLGLVAGLIFRRRRRVYFL